jgi:argininosuccinate lyase
LPFAYDRDLQTDKQHVRQVFATTTGAFRAMAGLVAEIVFDVERLEEAASDESLLATDAAEQLVKDGVPFRRAHEQVASRVRSGQPLGAGPGAHSAVRARSAAGGPSTQSVRSQISRLRGALKRLS